MNPTRTIPRRLDAASACLIALAAATGCAGPEKVETARRPNVVVIVMDTVRADHLSLYGYPRLTSPTLDRLAAESTVFDQAYSVSSWTVPAHASLFTGLLPLQHHATQERWRLDTPTPTLAERLREAGYQTWGLVDNPVLAKEGGYARGFTHYLEEWRAAAAEGEDLSVLGLRQLLEQREPQAPFFLFVNLIEPHNPFDSSRQFMQTFVTDPGMSLVGHDPRAFYLGLRDYRVDEIQHLEALYDAEILYTDFVIGQMVEELHRQQLFDDTLFIVTSDHGENIGDHEHVGHLFSLYESTVRVPLLIRYPAEFSAGERDRRPAQLIDVAPTVLAIAGLEPGDVTGVDLRDAGAREGRALLLEYYRPRQALMTFGDQGNDPRLERFRRRLHSVVHEGRKLIVDEHGEIELYDLTRDPEELRRLEEPQSAANLQLILDDLLLLAESGPETAATDPSAQPDEDTLEALRALGYVR